MFLSDTNVLSEMRRLDRANEGVRAFFDRFGGDQRRIRLSVATVTELRQGVFSLRHKGDAQQASVIETWVDDVLHEYARNILIVDQEVANLWARLRVPHREPALDKLIAATAIVHGLTVATRNVRDFESTGVETFNPFE
jgi:toxin FitB